MATSKAAVSEVEVGSAPIDRFESLLGPETWREFAGSMSAATAMLRGRTVWNVNSTAKGGGVAELLASLIPYARGCDIDERWLVIQGSPQFFDVTKKIHTLLHGLAPDGSEITPAERVQYEEVLASNSIALADVIRPHDVAVLHDPQTAGLIPALRARGVHVIWRSHVGIDQPNQAVRTAWSFLTPYVKQAGASIFSRQAYAFDGLDSSRVSIIAPCVDPFTPKNDDIDDHVRDSILRASGIVHGGDGEASFMRQDGTRGRVNAKASTGGLLVPYESAIVLQVSRWDRLKDPAGVMDGFAQHVAPRADAWLVLAGPATDAVRDDPEQPEILSDLLRRRDMLPETIRGRVVLAQLPMQDADENAAIVNALQRRAAVVVQKSLAEGFGLTVSEAMWKSRPVVASRVGGIEDQIEDGVSGVLIDDPRDLRAFGDAVVGLLLDRDRSMRLGQAARTRVIRRFLPPRHMTDMIRVIENVLH